MVRLNHLYHSEQINNPNAKVEFKDVVGYWAGSLIEIYLALPNEKRVALAIQSIHNALHPTNILSLVSDSEEKIGPERPPD